MRVRVRGGWAEGFGLRVRVRLREGVQARALTWKPGIKNPSVLPEPVLATPITSRFCMAAGHEVDWMTDGFGYPALPIAAMIGPGRLADSKVRKGGGEPPYTLMSFSLQKAATSSFGAASAPLSSTSL